MSGREISQAGRRYKLGRHPVLSLAQACQKAKDTLARKQLGADFTRVSCKDLKSEFPADKQAPGGLPESNTSSPAFRSAKRSAVC